MTLLSNQYLYRPLPLHITSAGRFNSFALASGFMTLGGGFSNQGWPANNRAFYAPMAIPARFTVARFLVCNGSNATGNTDVGLYSATGARLLSTGTIARAGTNVVQYFDVANQSFPPGNYYLALVLSSTAGAVMFSANAGFTQLVQMTGMTIENLGSTVLPATMTPAASTALQRIPCFGFTQSDTL